MPPRKCWSASATTRWCSCPASSCFPAAASTRTDNRVPVAAPIPKALEDNLMKGSRRSRRRGRARWRSPRSARPARKPGSASGAGTTARRQSWKAHGQQFTEAGLLPDPSGLFLIARAITPPGRVRRFDTRFFTADASAIAHRVEGVVHAEAELVEPVWVDLGSKHLADAHPMTKNVLERTGKASRHRPAGATTRRCRSSISTATGCRRTCWGRKAPSPVIRGSAAEAIQLAAEGSMDCFFARFALTPQ